MKRLFDFLLSLFVLLVLALPLVLLALVVRLSSPGPVLYWSDRVGRNNVIFRMPKFRSMRIDTPAVATHLLRDPDAWLTPVELLERCRAGMVIGHLAERFARYAVMLEDVLQKEGEK